MIITHALTFHLDHRTETVTIDAVQGDTSRELALSLVSGGAPWEPPEEAWAALRFRKSDGTGGCYDTLPDGSAAWDISGNTLTIRLAPQVTTVAGIVELQAVLYCGSDELATFTALLSVQADPSLDTLESENYANLSGWIQAEMDNRWEAVFNDDGYINSKVDDLHHRVNLEFSPGTISETDGSDVVSVSHIRSTPFPFGGQDVKIVMPDGVMVALYYYDENNDPMGRSTWLTESGSTYCKAPYARCVAAYGDGAQITDVEALARKVAVFCGSDSHDPFRGNVVSRGHKYFSRCQQDGYYQFTAEDLESLGDAPDIACGGILEVRYHGGSEAIQQTIHTTDGQVWFRSNRQPFQRLIPPVSGASGENGATFTPSLSAAGDLSWTNDKGLDNPPTINIMGPQGIQGEKGEQGLQGEPGADGYTPVKGTDYFTAADQQTLITGLKNSLTTEVWTFTLEDGTTVEKQILLG